MNIVINRKKIIGALKPLVPLMRSNEYPIVKNVLIAVEKDITITGVVRLDSNIFVAQTIPAKTDGTKKKILLPADELLRVCRNIEGEEVYLSLNPPALTDRMGNEYVFSDLPDPEEFPETPFPPPDSIWTIWFEGDVAYMGRAVSFLAAKDPSRSNLTGVLLECEDENLRIVASDGYRMGIASKRLEKKWDFHVVIPPIVFNFHFSWMTFGSGKDDLSTITGPGISISGKWVYPNYPDYEAVIPSDWRGEIEIDRMLLRKALKKIGLKTSVIFDLKEKILSDFWESVRIRTPFIEKRKLAITKIAFKSGLMDEILKHIKSERIIIHFTTPENAIKIEPVGTESFEVFYLLMPIRGRDG